MAHHRRWDELVNWVEIPFPIRDDFTAYVQVPKDLTASEAKRLAEMILTLASPGDDNEDAAEIRRLEERGNTFRDSLFEVTDKATCYRRALEVVQRDLEVLVKNEPALTAYALSLVNSAHRIVTRALATLEADHE